MLPPQGRNLISTLRGQNGKAQEGAESTVADGDRLVLFATAPSEAAWEKSREAPILKDWHDYMAKLLETDDEGNITFEMLPEAFSFGMFKA